MQIRGRVQAETTKGNKASDETKVADEDFQWYDEDCLMEQTASEPKISDVQSERGVRLRGDARNFKNVAIPAEHEDEVAGG